MLRWGDDVISTEVGQQILSDHNELRSIIADIEVLLGVVHLDAEQLRELQQKSSRLLTRLQSHIDHEDSILVPALRAEGAEGTAEASSLHDHHEDQRKQLRAAIEQIQNDRITAGQLRVKMMSLVAELYRDMEHEEQRYVTA